MCLNCYFHCACCSKELWSYRIREPKRPWQTDTTGLNWSYRWWCGLQFWMHWKCICYEGCTGMLPQGKHFRCNIWFFFVYQSFEVKYPFFSTDLSFVRSSVGLGNLCHCWCGCFWPGDFHTAIPACDWPCLEGNSFRRLQEPNPGPMACWEVLEKGITLHWSPEHLLD